MTIKIRELKTREDMAAAEEIQLIVWPGNEIGVMPSNFLIAIANNGGTVLGAFDGKKMVGFVYGFPGLNSDTERTKIFHYSHKLAVHPNYRSRGIGYQLKCAQRHFVQSQGLDLITWTYDPLLSSNAFLNISKLGAVCYTYKRNLLGSMRDSLNFGLPSDRFQVMWFINFERVEERLSKGSYPTDNNNQLLDNEGEIINPCQINSIGWPVPSKQIPFEEKEYKKLSNLFVEIPPDFLALKNADMDLALQWRKHTRKIFESLFSQGYYIRDFFHTVDPSPHSYYVLSMRKEKLT